MANFFKKTTDPIPRKCQKDRMDGQTLFHGTFRSKNRKAIVSSYVCCFICYRNLYHHQETSFITQPLHVVKQKEEMKNV